jgi:hypothetical protein
MASKIGAEGRFRRLSCIRRSSSSARWNDRSKLVSYRASLLKAPPSLAPASIAHPEEDLVPVPLIGRAPPFRASIKSISASSTSSPAVSFSNRRFMSSSCLFGFSYSARALRFLLWALPPGWPLRARLPCAWLSRFDIGDLLGFPNFSPHFGRGLLLFAI